jgi:hypothetical protein
MTHRLISSRTRRLRRGRALVAAAGLLAFAACNLDVLTPDVVPPEATAGEGALPTLLAGAVGDFAAAYAGVNNGNSGEGLVLNSGLFTDEFVSADYFNTHIEVDSRDVHPSNGSNTTVMRRLFQALTSANNASARYSASTPDASGHARTLSLAGYVYTLIAEDYCSGVPFSTINPDGSFNYGSPLSTDQMLTGAVAKFDSAIVVAKAAGDDRELSLAEIGKGRALLDAGQFDAAAAAVANVPDDYNFSTEHSVIDPRTENGVYALTHVSTRYTTLDQEGGNGLPYVSAKDPRVQFDALGVSAFDQTTALFAPAKYSSYSSPVAIATGTEARLIEAEAALKGGSYPTALGILNSLRAAHNVSPLAPVVGTNAQVDQLFRERAFWLFATGHRMGDLRRLVREYNRAQTDVYPSGEYFKGPDYGDQVAFPVPQTEENNPNFDRAACDPTKA